MSVAQRPTVEEAREWHRKQAEMHPGIAPGVPDEAVKEEAQVIEVETLPQAAAKALGAPSQVVAGGYRVLVKAPVLLQIKNHVLSKLQALAFMNAEEDHAGTLMELLEMEDLVLECLQFFCAVDAEGNDLEPSTEHPKSPSNLKDWFHNLCPEDGFELMDAYAGTANWPYVMEKVKSMLGKLRGGRARALPQKKH
jgi:hypothetical protein